MEDELLTNAEAAYLDEDGGITDGADEEAGVNNEQGEDQQDEAGGIEEDEVYEEEDSGPFEQSYRYPEATMTDTVPPEFEAAIEALTQQFDDSEIEITEYLKQRAILDRQIVSFQIEEASQQKAYNSWMDAQDVFLSDNMHYIDNSILYGALDKAVEEIRLDARAKNMSPAQIIAAGDYLVRAAFGQSHGQVETVAPKQQSKQERVFNERPNIPTLSKVPASMPNETTDPFSAIERLTGGAKEDAVARLSPEQFARYLAS